MDKVNIKTNLILLEWAVIVVQIQSIQDLWILKVVIEVDWN